MSVDCHNGRGAAQLLSGPPMDVPPSGHEIGRRQMRFTVYLPNCMHVAAITQPWEHQLTGADIARVAQRAEQLGYSMVFLPEHFLTPTDHLELSGDHYFDATTAQAFIAGATSTITIGSMVTILPLHNPVIAAKAIATLDGLPCGR